MDLFEYQAKEYFRRFGVPLQDGRLAATPDEAVEAAGLLGLPVVLKAQVLTGGRGKVGGVRLASSAEEVRAAAVDMIGMEIHGHTAHTLWLEPATHIVAEHYASFSVDRRARAYALLLSADGGVDVESLAIEKPDALLHIPLEPGAGFAFTYALDLVRGAGFDPRAQEAAADALVKLYTCFVDGDADLVEVNPLALTSEGDLLGLDAKVTLDDNAAFRHPDWADLAGSGELDDRELLARRKGLQYVGLHGSVGIIANGAGLAMSTCDVVEQAGGSPANFLDIGGGAGAEVMAGALEVVNSDHDVRAILVNVFGGITRGEQVAAGIVHALEHVEISSPVVVRLDGTHAAEGRAILAAISHPGLISAPTMLEAARTAVELAPSRPAAP
ncbi:MAG: ADP-forming succinate--CoA ligase subunit beta [Acidimicrobiales bacterium]